MRPLFTLKLATVFATILAIIGIAFWMNKVPAPKVSNPEVVSLSKITATDLFVSLNNPYANGESIKANVKENNNYDILGIFETEGILSDITGEDEDEIIF